MPRTEQVHQLLLEIAQETNHRHFVVIGSLSVLGTMMFPPAEMTRSIAVDVYLKTDPEHLIDANRFGEGSPMTRLYGCYVNPVTPQIVRSPAGWESRLVPLAMSSGIVIWFMDIIDAATSKLLRGELRDLDWVASGLQNNVIHAGRLQESIKQANDAPENAILAALEHLHVLTTPRQSPFSDDIPH